MQIKTTTKFYITPIVMPKFKHSCDITCSLECRDWGTLFHCWWDYKLVHLLWESIWQFFRKLKIVLPEDRVVPLMGIYTKDAPPYHKDICSTVFMAYLY